ncbi:MAG: hypothetical protein PHR60_04035 [Eubacteriales bacterium]|nr:hypothetical protein [Eubacteriales bacterium]
MNRLKDILYDKNDLLVALVILAIAGFVIYSRINVIMGYPGTLVAQAGAESPPVAEQIDESDDADQQTDETNETDEPEIKQVSINILYGATGNSIAQLLIDNGLIQTKEEFYDAVAAAGADTRLQAGNFKIPSNATPAEIIAIITN